MCRVPRSVQYETIEHSEDSTFSSVPHLSDVFISDSAQGYSHTPLISTKA